jgi:hypothetical protein
MSSLREGSRTLPDLVLRSALVVSETTRFLRLRTEHTQPHCHDPSHVAARGPAETRFYRIPADRYSSPGGLKPGKQARPRTSRACSGTAGTYGKVCTGFDVTDSLPIPRRTGAFEAIENITSGALSVSDLPFHSASRSKPAFRFCKGRMFGKKRRGRGYPSPNRHTQSSSSPRLIGLVFVDGIAAAAAWGARPMVCCGCDA